MTSPDDEAQGKGSVVLRCFVFQAGGQVGVDWQIGGLARCSVRLRGIEFGSLW